MKPIKSILTLFLLLTLGIFSIPALAIGKYDTTVTTISVDNKRFYDIEIMLSENEEVLLPIKQIASILAIPVKLNHSTKEISFTSAPGKIVKVTKTDIFLNNAKVSSKNVYLKSGVMEEVKDEIFADEKSLSKIFNTNISAKKTDLTVFIRTLSKNIDTIAIEEEVGERVIPEAEEVKPTAHQDILLPMKKKEFTVETLGYSNHMNSDKIKQVYLNDSTSSVMFNNNSDFVLKGSAFKGGNYLVDLTSSNYSAQPFSFGGLSFRYRNKYRNIPYEIGRVTGFRGDEYTTCTSLLGVQVFNYDLKDLDYRAVEGMVDEKSLINVYVNDEFYKTIDTYMGYYSLNNVYPEDTVRKITLEELKEDGSKVKIFERKYSNEREGYGEGLLNNERRFSALMGLSGYNDRLFSQNGYIYQMNTKKFVFGVEQKFRYEDKSYRSTQFTSDKILSENKDAIWGQNYYNNYSILSSGTFVNPNLLEGYSIINTYARRMNDNLTLKAVTGISHTGDGWGQSFSVDSEYVAKSYRLRASVYEQSPKFYLAGTEAGFASDRIGGKIGGNYRYKKFSISGNINRYFSNINNRYEGGITTFTEGNFGVSGTLPKAVQLRLSSSARQGTNNTGENLSYNWDFSLSRNFKNVRLEAGKQENSYKTNFSMSSGRTDDFESLYSVLYARSEIKMPKEMGDLSLEGDIINITSNNRPNDYNSFKIGYRFPEIKRVQLSTNVSKNYGGANNGFNYGLGVGYRTKTGTVVSLNYQYNTDGGYLFDNMYIPANNRHSINLSFNDTLAVVPSGIKPVGFTAEDKGFIEVVAFIDKDKNGKYDAGDVGVKNVPIKMSWRDESSYTQGDGFCQIEALEKGAYKIALDNEKMNAIHSAVRGSRDSYLVLVKPKSTTRVEFPIISSVGVIQGNLKIVDDFDRKYDTSDFIVVLHDENDVEAAYSTVDTEGNYYFSGISPGKYVVKLDDSFLEDNNLESYQDKGKANIDIPYSVKEFIEFKDINLIYRSW